MKRYLFALMILTRLLCSLPAAAFNPPEDTQGPLTVKIADPGKVTALDQPISVPVTLTNAGATVLDGTVNLEVTDNWRIQPPAARAFHLDAHSSRVLPFSVVAGRGSYAALYPVHARVTFEAPDQAPMHAHAILILSVSRAAVATSATPETIPLIRLAEGGCIRLDLPGIYQPSFAVHDQPVETRAMGWTGTDPTTGCNISLTTANRGDLRHALSMHEPWRTGWGRVWLDYRLQLPSQKPITLQMATAIRDSLPSEPLSDGVDFQVLVNAGNGFKQIFNRFSAAKRWQPASIDLSDYAGKQVTLRLLQDPGPAHNTTCDQSFWGDPCLIAGPTAPPESSTAHESRVQKAIRNAMRAIHGMAGDMAWKISGAAGTYGAALVPGPVGFPDCVLAFTDGQHTVTFNGFDMDIDDQPVGSGPGCVAPSHLSSIFTKGQAVLSGRVSMGDLTVPYQVRVWAEQGTLRTAFSMPNVIRDAMGNPRFTRLGIGPASQTAHRVYAGFGNVLQDPGSFILPAGAPFLTTRHVGVDFQNGISLLEASDIFPDYFEVDPTTRTYSLVAHLDATFTLAPSSHGAFSAAVVYRKIANFQPGGGVSTLLGRMCMDQWGGDYLANAEGIEHAAHYGLTDAVYVQHVWQRWGYDYRLPNIYPPAGSFADFLKMVDACKRNGILYCPHDNYIDFYPDARRFSYSDIVFNSDGTPQRAWFNASRKAQSYRWLPTAFMPWLEENLKQVEAGFAPTAYFVDVFSAIPPFDFYDQHGKFYPKTVTAERWGAAFDRIRQILGGKAPTISEAGCDSLVGHLDAGEADHYGWIPSGQPGNSPWNMPAADGERVPWADFATHGDFILLGGGLASRYDDGQNPELHGYGSDDYLCTTVMGGRSPMAEGPFSRKTVMTYWLLHDVCKALAHQNLESLQFANDNIHRQVIDFSAGGQVTVNRDKNTMEVDGQVLPQWGFIARIGNLQASVTNRNGIVTGYSSSPGLLFADARPDTVTGPDVRVVGVDNLGEGRFHIHTEWVIARGIPPGYRPFIHFVDPKVSDHEGILFQGGCDLNVASMTHPGVYPAVIDARLPANTKLPDKLDIRVGLYSPDTGGQRLPMRGLVDSGGRERIGALEITDNPTFVKWLPEPPDPDMALIQARLNTGNVMVDFGPVATNGAFRLEYSGTNWKLIPLPNSDAFTVQLQLANLGAAGARITRVTTLSEDGIAGVPVPFQQKDGTVKFTTDAGVFGYTLAVKR